MAVKKSSAAKPAAAKSAPAKAAPLPKFTAAELKGEAAFLAPPRLPAAVTDFMKRGRDAQNAINEILAAAAAAPLSAPLTPALTLTATLDTLAGTAAGSIANPAKLLIALCGFGMTLPRIVGTAMLAQVGPWAVESTGGEISTPIWGNDVITPSGTFYSIAVVDGNHNIVQVGNYVFTGSGTIDLSEQTQVYPSPPTPPGLIPVYTNPPGQSSQSVDGPLAVEQTLSTSILDVSSTAGSLDIDGELSNVFRIVLTENVTDVTFANMIPGATYTFIIVQNSTGGWTFAWPASALNPVSPVNPVANGKTVWTGVCDIDGTVMSNGYYP